MLYSDATTPATVVPAPGLLIKISSGGRDVDLRYDANSRLAAASASGSTMATYSYDEARPELLTGVKFADGSTRSYLYEPALNPLQAAWSESDMTARLSQVAGIAQQQYTGPSSTADIVQLIIGRASRSGLTGILDENASRYATYTYDTQGRVSAESHGANVETYGFNYLSSLAQTVVTDSLGTASTRNYANIGGVLRMTSQTQAAGSGCTASTRQQSFDTNGNTIQKDDFNGTRTCYAYDTARNLPTTRVEGLNNTAACSTYVASGAALPAGTRKTSTQWHPDWRLATKVAEPGRITTHIYNGEPDPFNGNAVANCASAQLPDGKPLPVLCKTVEQATTDSDGRLGFSAALQAGVTSPVWRYTYNANGKILSATDPRGKTTTHTYYSDTTADHAVGDLATVTDTVGLTTQYPKYNAHGQLLRTVDANGATTDYTYDLRQRLTSANVAGQNTLYEYWPTGLLKKVTQPDGNWIAYAYDAAHRLTDVSDKDGNSVHYTLDNAGNRTQEQAKDPSGALSRQMSRVMDALSRVQQATGRE